DKAAQRSVFGAPASITLIVFSGHAFVVSHSNLPGRKDTKMKATCMNQLELAVRWGISHRTLERWRWTGEGPKFLKVGGRVVYRLSDVEEYERSITSSASSPYFLVYQAAQVKLGDLGFLSRDITVRDLLLN